MNLTKDVNIALGRNNLGDVLPSIALAKKLEKLQKLLAAADDREVQFAHSDGAQARRRKLRDAVNKKLNQVNPDNAGIVGVYTKATTEEPSGPHRLVKINGEWDWQDLGFLSTSVFAELKVGNDTYRILAYTN